MIRCFLLEKGALLLKKHAHKIIVFQNVNTKYEKNCEKGVKKACKERGAAI